MTFKIKAFVSLIKFEHTIFALPFAYLGYILGSRGQVVWAQVLWVTLAMVGGRTAGMCLNRLFDLRWDSLNPRTRLWPHVTGEVKRGSIWLGAVLGIMLLLFSAARLNPLCLKLSPVIVVLLWIYPYLKRFTPFCHFGIGLVLACAPVGGAAAATGRIDSASLFLGAAVFTWVAGFDIFYSLQDVEFDRQHGLHSIAADWGISQALWTARGSHVLTLIFLVGLGIITPLNWIYWAGLALASLFLGVEHRLMRGARLRNIEKAFFTMNAVLSTVFSALAALSVLTGKS